MQITPTQYDENGKNMGNRTWQRFSSRKSAARMHQIGGDAHRKFHHQLVSELEMALHDLAADDRHEVHERTTQDLVAKIEGKPAVCSAWNEKDTIQLWRKKRDALLHLESGMREASADSATRDDAKATMELLKTPLDSLNAINGKILRLLQDGGKKWRPVAAFVTFEYGQDQANALKLRVPGESGGEQPLADQGMVVIGGRRCLVERAPEPSAILFHHLQYTWAERLRRSFFYMAVMTVILLLGFYLLTTAQKFSHSMDFVHNCKYILGSGADFHGGYLWQRNFKDAAARDRLQVACPEWSNASYASAYKQSYVDLEELGVKRWPLISTETAVNKCHHPNHTVHGEIWDNWRLQGEELGVGGTEGAVQPSFSCHRMDTKPAMLYEGGDFDSMCYACICSVDELKFERHEVLGTSYCKRFDDDMSTTQALALLAMVWVNCVNQALKRGIRGTASFLKQPSLGTELSSRYIKVFMTQLTNTAILSLLLNFDFPVNPKRLLGADYGVQYKSVNPEWYAEVGAPMAKTMLIQFLFPLGFHLLDWAVSRAKRLWGRNCGPCGCRCRRSCRRSAMTQNLMNDSQVGPDFDLAAANGECMLAMSVTLIFGSGVPILYPIAMAGFSMRYMVDKAMVLRVCKQPPMYDQALTRNFPKCALFILMLHACIGTVLLGFAGGRDPTDTLFTMFPPHMLPMLLATAIVAVACVEHFLPDDKLKRAMCHRCRRCCFARDGDLKADEKLAP